MYSRKMVSSQDFKGGPSLTGAQGPRCQVRLGWIKFAGSLTAPMARLTGLAVGGTSPSPPPSLYFSSLSTKLHLIVLAKSTLKATSLGSSSKSARLSPTGMQSPR